MARQEELPAAVARRIAAGQRKGLARAVAQAAGRVFEGLGESPGARYEDLWAQDRGGVQQG